MSGFVVWPGVPYPLGATCRLEGVNFASASHHATAVEVCLFDPADPKREIARLPLSDQTDHVFHGFIPGLEAGALYCFRVHGPWAPQHAETPGRDHVESGRVEGRVAASAGRPAQGRHPHHA
jgi:glycogen operon protein